MHATTPDWFADMKREIEVQHGSMLLPACLSMILLHAGYHAKFVC